MGFASAYLESGALFPVFIDQEPEPDTGLIIVIPAYDEPEIESCLSSLASCRKPPVGVEVIVVVNAPPSAGSAAEEKNSRTIESIKSWKGKNEKIPFRLYIFDAGQPRIKGWGVGAARKTGMDEAVRRFDILGKPEGVIVSLDSDCEVDSGYLISLWNDFGLNVNAGGCSICFQHRESMEPADFTLNESIRQYELHLRYFVASLRYIDFPYPFHTIGSAMAVKALKYVKAGGMNRRQGGEDFYFIQKLVAGDDFINLRSTTVYPSQRLSLRVPFGTGPVISKLLNECDGRYFTYDPDSFEPLKKLFSQFSGADPEARAKAIPYGSLGKEIALVIEEKEWEARYCEIKGNTATSEMFTKRFFAWFNSFMIVKYLNSSHLHFYKKIPVNKAAKRMLQMSGDGEVPETTEALLEIYRKIDRGDKKRY